MKRWIWVWLLGGIGMSVPGMAAAGDGETCGSFHAKFSPRDECRKGSAKCVSPRYVAIELGADQPGSVGWAINDFGWVAGSSPNVWEQPQATLWVGKEMIDLGTLGGQHSEALGVNNRGQVVGRTATADGGEVPFVWADGEMRAIPGITAGQASGINERGEIAGISYEGARARGFIYDGHRVRYLSDSNEHVTAYSINNRGQVVGSMSVGPGAYHGFVWKDGVFTDLKSLGGDYDTAIDINDRGMVVGSSAEGGISHAVLWVGAEVSPLGVNELFQGGHSSATSINNRGEIVGESNAAGVRAFYYRAGNIVELNAITRSPSMQNNYALGINTWGAIAGAAFASDDDGAHTTLWFPWR